MSIKNQEILFESFGKKWRLDKDQVFYIYNLIQQTGVRYGKARKILAGFGFNISSRQLRYFYRKVKLHNRLDIVKKGKPVNYRELLKKG